MLEGAIAIATKGMPTGITLEPPRTGFSGNWPNFTMVLLDDGLNFDIGRKSIPSRSQPHLKQIARDIFYDINPWAILMRKSPVIAVPTTQRIAARLAEFERLRSTLSDLGLPNFPYVKNPDGQEAAVVAVFHELVAADHLPGYLTYKTGYKETYDLWGHLSVEKERVGRNHWARADASGRIEDDVIMEFKFAGQSLLRDVEDHVKDPQEMDLIVCWDFDERACQEFGVMVEVIPPEDRYYPGARHSFRWPAILNLGADSVKPVLSLRLFVADLIEARFA
jgi:hypothetical protein